MPSVSSALSGLAEGEVGDLCWEESLVHSITLSQLAQGSVMLDFPLRDEKATGDKTKDDAGATLVKDEERATGKVGWDVYMAYLNACGGVKMGVVLGIMCFGFFGLRPAVVVGAIASVVMLFLGYGFLRAFGAHRIEEAAARQSRTDELPAVAHAYHLGVVVRVVHGDGRQVLAVVRGGLGPTPVARLLLLGRLFEFLRDPGNPSKAFFQMVVRTLQVQV